MNKTELICIRVTKKHKKELEGNARLLKKNLSEILREAIDDYLELMSLKIHIVKFQIGLIEGFKDDN